MWRESREHQHDWTIKETVRAKMRVLVRRILKKYGYPPDLCEEATRSVLEQAELLCAEWAAVGQPIGTPVAECAATTALPYSQGEFALRFCTDRGTIHINWKGGNRMAVDKGAIYRQLAEAGLWHQASAFRDEARRRHKANGLTKRESLERAWSDMAERFLPSQATACETGQNFCSEPDTQSECSIDPSSRSGSPVDLSLGGAGVAVDVVDIQAHLDAIEVSVSRLRADLQRIAWPRRAMDAEEIVSGWVDEYLPDIEYRAAEALELAIEKAMAYPLSGA